MGLLENVKKSMDSNLMNFDLISTGTNRLIISYKTKFQSLNSYYGGHDV